MPDPNINTGLRAVNGGPIDRSVLSMSGADQTIMPANPLRKAFLIQNNGANTINVTYTKASAAAGVGVITLAVGASLASDRMKGELVLASGPVVVRGTAGQPVYAEEWQIGGYY